MFVTGGRGTSLPIAPSDTGASYTGYSGGTDIGSRSWYVTASITPSGSLAVLYLPDATGTENGGPVTINTSKMAAGFTAHWMDPVTGALTSTAAGSSYSTEMTNSLGENDWVLVLQGPARPGNRYGPPAVRIPVLRGCRHARYLPAPQGQHPPAGPGPRLRQHGRPGPESAPAHRKDSPAVRDPCPAPPRGQGPPQESRQPGSLPLYDGQGTRPGG